MFRRLRPALIACPLALLAAHCGRPANEGVEHAQKATSALGWSASTTPAHAFSGHTASLVGDGRVLFAGGSAAHEETEIFDPRTRQFRAGPKMLASRIHHRAETLLSGKVLLVGGDPALTSAEVFDPASETTTATGSMVAPHANTASARLLDGRVLVAGGSVNAELWDPATGKFTVTSGGAAEIPSMITLRSGKVVLFDFGGSSLTLLFDPATTGWTSLALSASSAGRRTTTLLPDGVVYTTFLRGSGVGLSKPLFAETFDPTTNAPSGELADPIPDGEVGMTATLLPDATLLFVGGDKSDTTPLVWDPVNHVETADADGAFHSGSTATSLPGGDVLAVGGAIPAADLRTWQGGVTEPLLTMTTTRAFHAAVQLHDGRALLVGGKDRPPAAPTTILASAETFDPITKTFTATAGSMTQPRTYLSAVLLDSGKVLVLGGKDLVVNMETAVATADVFDPTTGLFHAVGAMAAARSDLAAVRLKTGEVLVTGGNTDKGTEIFDPLTETFHAGPPMVSAHTRHGLVRLPDGRVLLVDAGAAEIFDGSSFRATGTPFAKAAGRSARLVPDGRVYVSGEKDIAAQYFDPTTEKWTTAPSLPFMPQTPNWGSTYEGSPLMAGAVKGYSISGAESRMILLDPLVSSATATASIAYSGALNRQATTSTILPTARVLVAGGDGSGNSVFVPITNTAFLYGDGASDAARPVLTSAPADVVGGTTVTITGSGFAVGETPLAIWISDTGDAFELGRITSFTDTSAQWLVPATSFVGHGWLHVSVRGISSTAVPVAIAIGQQAANCRFDSECGSGVCADGFCCDRTCTGTCQACSAARKGSGVDGTCGTIPFGRDTCKADDGTQCTKNEECTNDVCAGGVCCNSACSGVCLSCALPGSVGVCGKVPLCDLTCDGDHTLKKIDAPDVDCAPYTCSGTACRTRCASVAECVAPAVCGLDGTCIAPPTSHGGREGFFGCAIGRTRSEGWWLGLLFFAPLLRRRRR